MDLSDVKVEDYLHISGVRLAEPGTPQWKLKPIREKNLKLIEQHLVSSSVNIIACCHISHSLLSHNLNAVLGVDG